MKNVEIYDWAVGPEEIKKMYGTGDTPNGLIIEITKVNTTDKATS